MTAFPFVLQAILWPTMDFARIANAINGAVRKLVKSGRCLANLLALILPTVVLSTLMKSIICAIYAHSRGSKLFKDRFKHRTTVEHYFKRMKEDYLLNPNPKHAVRAIGIFVPLLLPCAYILMPGLSTSSTLNF